MLADALRAHPAGLDEAFALVDGLDVALVHGLARLDDDRAAALEALVAAADRVPGDSHRRPGSGRSALTDMHVLRGYG